MTNRRAVVYERGRRNGRTARECIPEVVQDVVSTVDPMRIIFFGAVARDEIGEDGDIDLLVVLDELAPGDRARLMGEIRFGIRAPMPEHRISCG